MLISLSEEILQAISREEEIVSEAITEVNDFCSRHEWVVEVHRFVRTWNDNILTSWRGRPTEKIEVSAVHDTVYESVHDLNKLEIKVYFHS